MLKRLSYILAALTMGCASEAPKSDKDVGVLSDYAPGTGETPSEASGESPGTGGTGSPVPDGVTVGPIDGLAAVVFSATGCVHIWTMQGDQCPGCGLAWDVDLSYMDASCDPQEDRSGTFELLYGAAYFNGEYWGLIDYYGGGYVYWRTYGYGYGYDYEADSTEYYIGYAFY